MAKRLQRTAPARPSPAGGVAAAAPQRRSRSSRVPAQLVTEFTTSLATLSGAGIPIVKALAILEGQTRPGPFKRVLGELVEDVSAGTSLSQALSKHERVFDPLYSSMVRAGEAGGVLDRILERLAQFREKAAMIRSKVLGALIYPAVVALVATGVVAAVIVWVIPKFKDIFESFDAELPAITQLLLDVSDFAVRFWYLVFGLPILLFALHGFLMRRGGAYRYRMHRWSLAIPLAGDVLKRSLIASFARTFGTLIEAGVPHLDALAIVRDTAANEVLAQGVEDIRKTVREGEGIARPMGESRVFDDLVVNMVDVGEATGELDRMLLRVADAYEASVDRRIEALFKIVEPALLIAMAVVVGFIVVALFMPLMSIMGQLGGGLMISVSLSLRQRVLLLLVAINVAVVGAEVLLLARGLVASSTSEAERHARDLVSVLRGQIRPEAEVNAVHILRWPKWDRLADALLVDRRLAQSASGRLVPAGLALNPMGCSARRADFDYQSIYGAIRLALSTGTAVEGVAGGRVIPIDHDGGVWGGLWYRFEPQVDASALLVRYFLPIFALSTLLLSAVTFVGLERFVLDPVARLASGARRIASGDLDVHVEEPPRRDELAELVRAFNAMTIEVRDAEERLAHEVREATAKARQAEAAAMTQRRLAATGELAAGIAHEINNPLGGLQNAVEVLARGSLPAAKREQYFELLRAGLERIRATVGQLLRFTPRRSVAAPLRPCASTPGPGRARARAPRAQAQGVELVVSCGGASAPASGAAWPTALAARLAELPAVQGEEGELGQALLNLLVNALDAVREGLAGGARAPRIEVELGARAGELSIAVIDNGPGVGPAELGRIGDLFYTTKEVGQGTGLGLPIVHNVAAAHGGRLELDSSPGAGFRATLVLPAAPGAPRAGEEPR